MSLEQIHNALLWCVILNYGLLLLWFAMFALARGWMQRFHGRWFRMSDQQFDAIHYALMGGYKLLIFVFFLMPYIALHIVR